MLLGWKVPLHLGTLRFRDKDVMGKTLRRRDPGFQGAALRAIAAAA